MDSDPNTEPHALSETSPASARRHWPRISIPALFYLMTCIAVGAAASQNNLGIYAFASCGAMTALLTTAESCGIDRWLRRTLAALLAIATLASIAFDVADPPKLNSFVWQGMSEEQWLSVVLEQANLWVIGLILATDHVVRSLAITPASAVPGRKRASLARQLGVAIIAICILGLVAGELNTAGHLAYIVMERIHQTANPAFRRAGVYPDHSATGYLAFWLSLAAIATSVISFLALRKTVKDSNARRRWRWGLLSLVLTLANLVHAVWYFGKEQYRIAPDFAEAGWQASPLRSAAAVAMASSIAAWVASRWLGTQQSLKGTGPAECLFASQRLGKWPAMVLATGCLLITLYEASILLATLQFHLQGSFGVAFSMTYICLIPFRDVSFLLAFVAGALGVQMIRRLPTATATRPLLVSRPQFFVVWTALTLWTLIMVPAIAAAGFCWWLGPWWTWV